MQLIGGEKIYKDKINCQGVIEYENLDIANKFNEYFIESIHE